MDETPPQDAHDNYGDSIPHADTNISHDDFIEYHTALQTEALFRLYDATLVLIGAIMRDNQVPEEILSRHAAGQYYFPPPWVEQG
jgi:hypothetical protein